MSVYVGTVDTATAAFTQKDLPFDAPNVSLKIARPTGAPSTVTYPGSIVRTVLTEAQELHDHTVLPVGSIVFTYDVLLDQPGRWTFVCWCPGADQVATPAFVDVEPLPVPIP